MKDFGRLCIITDNVIQNKYTHIEIAGMAIKGGTEIIQFRDKAMPTNELLENAIKMRKLCNKHDVIFIVNDRVDIAMLSGADGVHLGKEDISIKDARKLLGKNKIIGGTAHNLKEALSAEKDGADYIGYGHIFETKTKIKTDKPKGLKNLFDVCSKIKIPIFAIGGIGLNNATDVMNYGAYGIAAVGSVLKSTNPVETIKKLRAIVYG
jgi:thiamine-phosphate pyrophosphorylase